MTATRPRSARRWTSLAAAVRRRAVHLGLAAFVPALGCGDGGPATPAPSGTPSSSPAALVWQWRPLAAVSVAVAPPRSHGVAVYDPVARRLVVFGGQGAGGLLDDVWAFDPALATWTALATSGPRPAARLGANAVYDPNGHQLVLWAGQQGARFFDDTWTLDLRALAWREVSPARRPQARYGAAAVFDPAERRLVQFAGFTDAARRFQDTQGFDLDTLAWEDLTPGDARPAVRCLVTGAYHAPSRSMVVYGGQQNGPLDDVWSFDFGTRRWTDLTPATRPAGRMLAVSFVAPDGRFVVFGGSTASGRSNETWAFDLATRAWSQLAAAAPPPAREAPMGAASDDGERFFVFGGRGDGGMLNDVWVLERRQP